MNKIIIGKLNQEIEAVVDAEINQNNKEEIKIKRKEHCIQEEHKDKESDDNNLELNNEEKYQFNLIGKDENSNLESKDTVSADNPEMNSEKIRNDRTKSIDILRFY